MKLCLYGAAKPSFGVDVIESNEGVRPPKFLGLGPLASQTINSPIVADVALPIIAAETTHFEVESRERSLDTVGVKILVGLHMSESRHVAAPDQLARCASGCVVSLSNLRRCK